MANLLIVYSVIQWPPVATIRDALYAFDRHSAARCWYLNVGIRRPPRWLRRVKFDAVVLHTTLLWDRVNPPLFDRHLRWLKFLDAVGGRRVVMPQDEYLRSRSLVRLIEQLEIDHVFSVAPESEWDKLYEGVDRERVGLSRVLTGYLSPQTLDRIASVVRGQRERPIAIGYRAAKPAPEWGRHGLLKGQIAQRFSEASANRGLRTDIATGASATIRGDEWYRFLAGCRYTIGVEGGASVHDPDGAIKTATDRYVADHPGASFSDVEANCFPGLDGRLNYVAISPRHLEACATRTAQVLVEGSYNGILKPGVHYIELRRDFSNLDAVLDQVERDGERERLTDAAYRDVIASGAYTYAHLVGEVDAVALADVPSARQSAALDPLVFLWARVADRLTWTKVALWVWGAGHLRAFALRALPERVQAFIRRRVAGTAAETAALQSAD